MGFSLVAAVVVVVVVVVPFLPLDFGLFVRTVCILTFAALGALERGLVLLLGRIGAMVTGRAGRWMSSSEETDEEDERTEEMYGTGGCVWVLLDEEEEEEEADERCTRIRHMSLTDFIGCFRGCWIEGLIAGLRGLIGWLDHL